MSTRQAVVMVTACLCIGSCAEEPAGPQSSGFAAGQPDDATDRSLTPEQYLTLGMPAVDRPWTSADYEAARQALLALARKDPRRLPHHRSTQSAAVIERLCDQENLGLIRNSSLPVQPRFRESLDLLGAHNAICKIYLQAQVRDPRYVADLLRMQSFSLYAVAAQLDLCDQFTRTLDPRDPSYPVRIEGLAKMKRGLAIMVRGILLTLVENKGRDLETRRILANSFADVYPTIAVSLLPLSRKELDTRVAELVIAENDGVTRSALDRALGSRKTR